MGMLTKEEKKELFELSHSAKLRKDFEIINKNHLALFMKKVRVNLDKYVKFLNFSNAFINHRQKTFKKIQGRNFKL